MKPLFQIFYTFHFTERFFRVIKKLSIKGIYTAVFLLLMTNVVFAQTSTVITNTATTTWTAPACVTTVTVAVIGGGGGGGGSASSKAGCGGGGGGGGSVGSYTVTPGNTYNIQVGTGGSAGANNSGATGAGGNGGNSWFESAATIIASGGNGAAGSTGTNGNGGGGTGATAGIGNLATKTGGGGATGVGNTGGNGGGGGGGAGSGGGGNIATTKTGATGGIAGVYGITGGSGGTGSTTNGTTGAVGTQPGGGGSGAYGSNTGGAGGAGEVSINWTYQALTISSNAQSAASICAGTTNVPIHSILVTDINTCITDFSFVTTGTYSTADVSNFKLYWTTGNTFATTNLLATLTPAVAGIQTFAAFTSPSAGPSFYLWVTMDVPASGVTSGHTIKVSGTANTNITSTPAATGGTTAASGTQTFQAAIASTISAAQTICSGNASASISSTAPTGGSGAYTYQWQQASSSGGTYSNVTGGSGATTISYTPPALTANTWYNVLVSSASCSTYTTSAIEITVDPIITATVTGAQSICSGVSPSAVTVAATGGSGSYTYQWQQASSSGGPYSNVTGGSGATTASYIPPALTANTWYKCIVSDANSICSSVTPTAVEITVQNISATVSSAQTICSGNTGSMLTASATGGSGTYTYQWQQSTTSSTTGFASIGGATSSTVAPGTLTATAWYTCVVSGTSCTSYTATPIQIYVQSSIGGTTVGAVQTICSGNSPATINATTPTGGSGSYTYQWQQASSSGGTYSNVTGGSGGTTTSYTPPTLTANTWYTILVNSGTCTTYTATAFEITVDPVVTATVTSAQTICTGNAGSTLSVTAAGGSGSYTYQWQKSTTSSTAGFATIAGATASTYSPPTLTVSTWYNCITTDAHSVCAAATSAAIEITVNAVISATVSSAQTICTGSAGATLTTTAAGGSGSYTYQWQKSTTSSTAGFATIAGATISTLAPGTLTAATWYNCIVSAGGCASYTSKAIGIAVDAATSATISATQTICSGSKVVLTSTSTGGSGAYTYKWVSSTTSSTAGFGNATGTRTASSYTTAALTTSTWYKLDVTSTVCTSTFTTTAIKVTVDAALAGTITNAQTICSGNVPATLTITATGGSGSYNLQWLSATATGGPYSNIAGATSSTYSPAALTANTWYECTVTDAHGVCTTTVTATKKEILVDAKITSTVTASAQTICAGSFPTTLTQTPAGGSGTYSYVWESSTTGSTSGFSAAGVTTKTLSAGAIAASKWYYCVVSDANSVCASINTNTVSITVVPSINTFTISAAQTICSGNSPTGLTTTSPTGGTGSYAYAWQQSTTGSTSGFGNAAGTFTLSSYAPGTLSTNTWYELQVNSGACSATSSPIEITVNSMISSNTISAAQTICSGSTPSALTGSTPTGGAGGGYVYVWQQSTTSSISGFVTATGTFTNIGYTPPALTTTTWYKRLVTTVTKATCDTLISAPIQIYVPTSIGTYTISAAQTICSGSTPSALNTTTPTGGNGVYTYKWQQSTSGSSSGFANAVGTYTNSGYSPPALTTATWYQLVVTDGCGVTNTSAPLAITIDNAISATIASAQTVCSGNSPSTFTVNATGGSGFYNYSWQSSATSGTSGFSSAGTDSICFTDTTSLTAANWYNCIVIDSIGTCGSYTTAAVAVAVQPTIGNNIISAAQTICSGSTFSALTGSTPTGGNGSYAYLWQKSASSTSGFANAGGTNTGSGYSNPPTALISDTWYWRIVTSGACTDTAAAIGIDVIAFNASLAQWIGGVSSDWTVNGNWCNPPSATVSVEILPGGTPSIFVNGAVCKDLIIDPGATLTMSTNYSLGVYGDWTNNGTFVPASSQILMLGSSNQTITGSGAQTFYDLTINNSGVTGSNLVTLSQPVTVTDVLTLTDGIVATSASNLLTLSNTATNATNAGSSGSFVNGPMQWGLNGSANTYVFPTGVGTSSYAPVALSNVSSSANFTCQYFNTAYSHVGTVDLSTTVTNTLVTLSGSQYWTVEPDNTVSAAVTLYWQNASASGINNCNDLVVAHYNTSSSNLWENTNGTSAATTTGSCTGSNAGTVTGGVVSSFSPFTFGSTSGSGQNPLPIGLLYFNAVYNGETINLSWATATETNNDYFTIERSLDGINYTVVATIPSQTVNGNSISELIYNFNDPNTTSGVYYYRLKQTNLDGSYSYSGVQEATIGGNLNFSFEIAPNPNNGKQMTVFISDPIGDQVIKMTICDVLGTTVFTQNFTTAQMGSSSFPVYFPELLNAGVYIVTITADNRPALSKRLIVN